MRIDQALARSAELGAVTDSPDLDLQLLLCHVLAKPRSFLYTWPERELTLEQQQGFEQLFKRRLEGEPIAHILGQQDFWTLTLEVEPSTLIPRPETELLVELALDKLAASEQRVADLGTGTGAIALALASERPQWGLSAVEFSPQAAALAERNRLRHKLSNVEVLEGSWCQPLTGRFDMILSNPPYIDPADPHLAQGDVRFEPRSALVAEHHGLADITTIAGQAKEYLNDNGWLLFEHGYDQGEAVRRLLVGLGYGQVSTHQDLNGLDRVTEAQYQGSCTG